jgi:hypothetical protein
MWGLELRDYSASVIKYYHKLWMIHWGIQPDEEDGSTAPFTSLALEEVCLK